MKDVQLGALVAVDVLDSRVSKNAPGRDPYLVPNDPLGQRRFGMSLDNHRKMGLQMNIGAIFGAAGVGLEPGYSNADLGASSDYRLVRSKPGPAQQVNQRADFAQLAREAKHRGQLAPGFCRSETIDQVSKVVALGKRERVGRDIPGHGYSGRALEREIGAQAEPRDKHYTGNQDGFPGGWIFDLHRLWLVKANPTYCPQWHIISNLGRFVTLPD